MCCDKQSAFHKVPFQGILRQAQDDIFKLPVAFYSIDFVELYRRHSNVNCSQPSTNIAYEHVETAFGGVMLSAGKACFVGLVDCILLDQLYTVVRCFQYVMLSAVETSPGTDTLFSCNKPCNVCRHKHSTHLAHEPMEQASPAGTETM